MLDYKIDWQFSSVLADEGDFKVNYMHVMAHGDKFENLVDLVRKNLIEVRETEDRDVPYAEAKQLCGKRDAVEYEVRIEHGFCPVPFSCGEGHNVSVQVRKTETDSLSSLIEAEMRGYEVEMTARRSVPM